MISVASLPARIAVEWWSSSGEQTRARLNELVEHFAIQYGRSIDIDVLQAEALSNIPAYRRPMD